MRRHTHATPHTHILKECACIRAQASNPMRAQAAAFLHAHAHACLCGSDDDIVQRDGCATCPCSRCKAQCLAIGAQRALTLQPVGAKGMEFGICKRNPCKLGTGACQLLQVQKQRCLVAVQSRSAKCSGVPADCMLQLVPAGHPLLDTLQVVWFAHLHVVVDDGLTRCTAHGQQKHDDNAGAVLTVGAVHQCWQCTWRSNSAEHGCEAKGPGQPHVGGTCGDCARSGIRLETHT